MIPKYNLFGGMMGLTTAPQQRLQVSESVFWCGVGIQGDAEPVPASAHTSAQWEDPLRCAPAPRTQRGILLQHQPEGPW